MTPRRRRGVFTRDLVVLGSLAIARELARGVFSEATAGHAGNAMRLARHLFEQELELHYVLEDPDPRLRQLDASDAKRRLALVNSNPGIPMRRDRRRELKALTAEAQRLEDAAHLRRKNNEEVPASDWGYLPNRRQVAQALDRESDYDLYYAGASWLSHPGVITIELQLRDDLTGLRPAGPSPADGIAQGVALAAGSMFSAIERANWVLGPIAGLADRLRDLECRVAHHAPASA